MDSSEQREAHVNLFSSLVKERRFSELRKSCVSFAPVDLAEIIVQLSPVDAVTLFRLLPTEFATDVFEYLQPEFQTGLLQEMKKEEAGAILNEMSPDDRTALLEELPATVVTQLLLTLDAKEREIAQALLHYPAGSVGRLMTTEFLTVRDNWTVTQVLNHIRQFGHDSPYLNVLYVVDENRRLLSDVRLREFLLQPAEKQVSEFRPAFTTALHAKDPKEDAIELFKRYDRTMLPVIDSTSRIVGIVTVDDVIDVAEEVNTRDIHQLGGQTAFTEPYLQIPIHSMLSKRAGWLVILFLGEMLTATAMAYFEDEIARAVILALFVPLIISSGGNSGSQATTLVIRAMALNEVSLKDWHRVLRRELLSGLGLGIILGTIGFLRIALWSVFSSIYGEHWLMVGITVAIALVGVVLWGSIAGSMLPFLLKRCGVDPATSSAPFVATLVDVTGLVIYFAVALVTLSGTLL